MGLAHKSVAFIPCDDDCKQCKWRFPCFTERGRSIQVVPSAEDLSRYGVLAGFEAEGIRVMRCPHCDDMFVLSQYQIANNSKFKCWSCGKFNHGSVASDKFGVLLGLKEITGW